MSSKRLLWMALLLALVPGLAAAQGTGQLTGIVTGPGDVPLSGVTVVVDEAGMAEITDGNGRYTLVGLPAGTYTVTLLAGRAHLDRGGRRRHGRPDHHARQERSTGTSASPRRSPSISASRRARAHRRGAGGGHRGRRARSIEREAADRPAAKLLEFTPGVDFTQSGLYDFNFNTRGFNSSLNRRILTLIDGRDPAVPFLGSQEWAALSFPLDELASVELVRGPGSALYGANAFNGVLNMTTKRAARQRGRQGPRSPPASSAPARRRPLGGRPGRRAASCKVVGGYQAERRLHRARATSQRASTAASARASGDTNCLPPRGRRPARSTRTSIGFGGLRLDKYFGRDRVLTLEGGTADARGPDLPDRHRPRAGHRRPSARGRASTSTPALERPRLLRQARGRGPGRARLGRPTCSRTENLHGEVQGNVGFSGGRGAWSAASPTTSEEIDTRQRRRRRRR